MSLTVLRDERLLSTFLEMVQIDSPSGDEGPMADYLMAKLTVLGLKPLLESASGNVIVDIPKHPSSLHNHILMVSGHMDVVPPCLGVKPVVSGEGAGRVITSDNTTVLGADDKAALAVMMVVLEDVLAQNTARPPLRYVFTTREETMLGGAKELAQEHLEDIDFSLIFDHTGHQGTVITQAPTYISFEIECLGKAAHAGISPELGVNAMRVAGHILSQLPQGRLGSQTTLNIGKIQGGAAMNVVPKRVLMQGEIRSHAPADLAHAVEQVKAVCEQAQAQVPGSTATARFWIDFKGYQIAPQQSGVKALFEVLQSLGITPSATITHGGSDNNIFLHRGVPGVVLSAGYVDPHALTESVALSEIATCADILAGTFSQFAQAPFAPTRLSDGTLDGVFLPDLSGLSASIF